MTPNPRSLQVKDTVRDAAQLISELDVRHVPILEGDTLVGIVSDRDLRETLGLDDPDERRKRLDLSVTAVMSSDVISVGPEDEVSDVIDLMIENKLGLVPVTEDETGLVGVVSYVDVLREARDSI
jgi:acetoin utilization protein AcuB